MAGFTNKQTSYPLCKLLRRSAKHSAQGLHNKCKLLLWLSTLQGSPDKIVNECALTPIQFGGLLSTLVVLLAHRYLSCRMGRRLSRPTVQSDQPKSRGTPGLWTFPHFVRSMAHDSIVEQEHLPLVKGPEPMSHLHEYFIPKGSVINRRCGKAAQEVKLISSWAASWYSPRYGTTLMLFRQGGSPVQTHTSWPIHSPYLDLVQ